MIETTVSQNLSDLHALYDTVIRAGKPGEMLTAIQKFLCSWPQVEQVLLVELDKERRVVSIWPDTPADPHAFLPLLLAWVQPQAPQSFLLSDLQEAAIPSLLRTSLLSADLRSLGILPLLSGDACQGYLLLGSSALHPFDATTWQWVQLAATPIGPALHCLQYKQEIATRKEAEVALRVSELRYRELYENAPNAYFSVGNDGRIYHVNQQAEKLTGYIAADLIGRAVVDIHVDSPVTVSAQGTFVEFLDGTEIREREMQLRRADGSTVWIDLTVTPIRNAEGEVVASRSVAVDISERRALREMRQAFVDMIVHDLRHPLGIIDASAEMLDFEIAAENEGAREFLGFIRQGAKQAIALVQNILDVHRLEQKQMPVSIQSVSATDVIQNIAHEFSVHLAQQNLELAFQFPAELPPVQGDPYLLERVLRNLLDNAIKFTPDGGSITIAAQVRVKEGKSGVQMAVTDQGPGISPEAQTRIFQLFSTGSAPGSGYGVGLSFCQLAMEAMGGRIWLESVPGQGSTFLIFLPFAA